MNMTGRPPAPRTSQNQPDRLAAMTERIARYQQNPWMRRLRRFSLAMAILFLLISLAPYLIPVSAAAGQTKAPFSNSAFRDINGVRLHYQAWPPANPPASSSGNQSPGASAGQATIGAAAGKVLLVHGLGGSTVSWQENVTALQAAGFWTIAVDLPGFGYSTRQTGFDHSQASRARLVWSLLESLESEVPAEQRATPWHLVGHSMGGGTIVAMALADPARTASLVLVDGAVFDTAPGPANLVFRFPPAARWLQVLLERVLVKPERIAGFLANAGGQPVPPERVAAYYQALSVPGTARAFADIVRTSRNEPVEGIAPLKMPVRAIWGDADTWVPLTQAEQIRQKVPRLALAVIPGAAHTPMETHPEAFNALLTGFLRQR